MCRKSQLHGWCTVLFGLGLLTGCCIESGFWCCALGIGALVAGFVQLGKK